MLAVIASPRPSTAQEWLNRLPKKAADELTFSDFKTAFETYYREHPVAAVREEVMPAFAFRTEEVGPKKALEEYKQFKRWEWFTEPRVYPTGRWDSQKVIAAFQRVAATDAFLFKNLFKIENTFMIAVAFMAGPGAIISSTLVMETARRMFSGC